MKSKVYHLPIRIYYEDTDHSGFVYYANYLKFFERAREHVLKPDELTRLWQDHQIGYAVYSAHIQYNEGCLFGDLLDIRSAFELDGAYKILWRQEAWKPAGSKPAVSADIVLVCLDGHRKLMKIPELTPADPDTPSISFNHKE